MISVHVDELSPIPCRSSTAGPRRLSEMRVGSRESSGTSSAVPRRGPVGADGSVVCSCRLLARRVTTLTVCSSC